MADDTDRPPDSQDSDLGLGTVASSQTRRRLLEKNGEFNVVRRGLNFWSSSSLYHHLLNLSWPAFLGWAALGYLGLNIVFAAIYVGLDVQAGALRNENREVLVEGGPFVQSARELKTLVGQFKYR